MGLLRGAAGDHARRGAMPAAVLVAVALVLPPVGTAGGASGGPRVETVAGTPGTGTATRLAMSPHGLLNDTAGQLLIGDGSYDVVRGVDLDSGDTTISAGVGGFGPPGYGDAGPASAATLRGPVSLDRLPDGSLLVVEASNRRVRRVATDGTISTFAGGGSTLGDGGPGTAAQLRYPAAVAVAADGSVLIADSWDQRVRRVATDGTITTVAGSGTMGFAGDGGPATAAALNSPEDVAALSDGSFVVADRSNHRVRKVGADGTITTLAGTGVAGPTGDGGPAILAQLNGPEGVEAAADGVYVADTFNNRVRRIRPDGVIETAAGEGTGGFYGDGGRATDAWLFRPQKVEIGPDGLFVADGRNFRVRRVDAAGIITSVAGNGEAGFSGDGGPAASAQMAIPYGIDVAPDGSLLFADTQTRRIRRIDAQGVITTVAGNGDFFSELGDGGPATAANIKVPFGIDATADGSIYVADFEDNRVRRISPDGRITTVAGSGGDGPPVDGVAATLSPLGHPQDVVAADDGTIYLADTTNNRVRRVGPDGTITTLAGTGVNGSAGDGGPASQATLSQPRAVALLADGDVLVVEGVSIRRVDAASGTITTVAGGGAASIGTGDGGPATAVRVHASDLAVAGDGAIFFVETSGMRVRRVSPDGMLSTIAGDGSYGFNGDGSLSTTRVSWPRGIALHPARDALYFGEAGRVRRVTSLSAAVAGGATTGSPTTSTTTAPTTTTTKSTSSPSQPSAQPWTPPTTSPPAPVRSGYWMLGVDGRVYAFGDAAFIGDAPVAGNPAVDLEDTPSGSGYWVTDAAGHVFAFGDAPYLGGSPALARGEAVTSISGTPRGGGYWLFTDRGRVVPYGNAGHFGDMAATRLNGPVLDSVPTPSGNGYYLVAGDGGIFAFGDARFDGSMGGRPLNAPVQSLVPDADGRGYWLVASDGGIFGFEAPFYGSMGSTRLNRPVTGMVGFRDGYLMVAEDGGIFAFGNAPFHGSLGDRPPYHPVTSVASL